MRRATARILLDQRGEADSQACLSYTARSCKKSKTYAASGIANNTSRSAAPTSLRKPAPAPLALALALASWDPPLPDLRVLPCTPDEL